MKRQKSDIQKSFSSKGVFPYRWAFTLLIPLRNIFLSPRKLIRQLQLQDDFTVMELGPGPGYFSTSIAKVLTNGRLVLADIQPEMLDFARRRTGKRHLTNVEFCLCDGKSFCFDDNSFDRIFMVTVIGEVENKEGYMKEFYRMLKTGGILSITELAGDPDKMSVSEVKVLAQKHHFSFYRLLGNEINYTIQYKK